MSKKKKKNSSKQKSIDNSSELRKCDSVTFIQNNNQNYKYQFLWIISVILTIVFINYQSGQNKEQTESLKENVYKQTTELHNSLNFIPKKHKLLDDFESIGRKFAHENPSMRAKHPIIIIPGFVTSALEVWEHKQCLKYYFRQSIWGSINFQKKLMLDPACWMEHLMLDPKTGLDPMNIKVRAIEGLGAVDFVTDGYWVFAKLIEELAIIGYDTSNLDVATQDWRLNFDNLELRDKQFSKLVRKIEYLFEFNNDKVIMLTHSLGSNLNLQFFDQLEKNGKLEHMKEMIHGWINVAGPFKGLAKIYPAMLSGEMRDTVNLGQAGNVLLDSFLGTRDDRRNVLRTQGCFQHVKPTFMNPKISKFVQGSLDIDLENSDDVLNEQMGQDWKNRHANTTIIDFANFNASNFHGIKIWSLYGVNYQTEVGQFFKKVDDSSNRNSVNIKEELNYDNQFSNHQIDYNVNQEDQNGLKVENGVILDNGDETIEIGSLDALKDWGKEGIKVVTRQQEGEESRIPFQRWDRSSKHVDILGNLEVIQDILSITTGQEITDKIVVDQD